MDNGIDNDLNVLIRETFGESKKFNIILNQSQVPLYDQSGLFEIYGESVPEIVDASSVTIRVNLSFPQLQYSSLELISAVIFHECLHGYLAATQSLTSNDGSHARMANNNYLAKMTSSLQKMYPNSQVDFEALKWIGLMKTDAFINSFSEIEKNNIKQKIEDFRTGTGTNCR